jgi:5-methylcytosine-specific restriction endonuclease McrA
MDPQGVIGFAEKILELIEEGRYTATYKFAVLLALIDVSLESTRASGAPPDAVTTRQLAEKVIEIYWPHAMPFVASSALVLKQNVRGQAEILSEIVRFREVRTRDRSLPRWEARRIAPDAYEGLVKRVERKLIEMPLPRLQMVGVSHRPFIYEIHWDETIRQRVVGDYQAGRRSSFDNRIVFRPDVAGYLIQLNGLLRPLIQRRWAAMVADLNRLEDSRLEAFLFGATRAQTSIIRAGLWTLQDRRCFYCNEQIREPGTACVDHFIPWSRYPDDGLDNLVVSDVRCNAFKSSSLPATPHLARWARRFTARSPEEAQLERLAERTNWERHPERNLGVARGIYFRLPSDARLWLRRREFSQPDLDDIRSALA